MLTALARRLELEPAELRRAFLLGAALFALTASYTLVKTARDAFFLAELPATELPWVYLGVGAFTLVASAAFNAATQRRAPVESLAGAAIVSALMLVVFAWGFGLNDHRIPVAFYLWVNAYGLILMSQFWNYTSSVSDPREAKRIFGLVGTGGVLGGLAGGLLAAPISGGAGLPALLVAGAFPLAAVALLVFWRVRRRGASAAPPAARVAPGEPFRHSYVRWLALAALCSVVVTGLLDYQFKVEIQRRYPSSGQLASFLGAFYTLVNLAALGIQLFFTRWALQTLGAGWSAAVLPTGLGLGAILTVFAPGFGPVLSTRLWDQVLRQSLNRAAGELFYFPLEPNLRRRAKSIIDAGLERAGDALAGLVILAVGVTLGASTLSLAIVVAALVGVWVAAWLGVRSGYVAELGRNLRRMNLGHAHEPVSLREASLLAEMTRLLDSPYERVVLHGVDLIEDADPARIESVVPRLLEHRSAAVRARGLALAGTRRMDEARPRVEALMEDPDASVRVAALRAHAVLAPGDPAGTVERFLDSEDPRLRSAAVQLVTEFAPGRDELRVRGILERRLHEGSLEERRAIAQALGRRPAPSVLHDLLGPLLRDSDPETRRAALRSSGAAQRRNHIPVLLESLGERAWRDAAREGLASLGEKVVGTLGDYLSDASVPAAVRHAVPRVLSDIGTQEAARALERCRERHDVRLAYRVLKAQNKIRRRAPEVVFDRARVDEEIENDVRAWLFAYVHYRTCPIGGRMSAERLFCIALNERVDQALNRVFRRLALVYDPENILAAYQGVTSQRSRPHGSALEFLDNALAPEHRALVLPLLDDAGDEGRLAFAERRFGIRAGSFEETLADVLEAEDQWLRTCALFVAGARRERALLPRVMQALSAYDPRVRETANWATLALGTTAP